MEKYIQELRAQFPNLNEKVENNALVYLDNAASAHKPQAMLEGFYGFYYRYYSNIHRSAHTMSRKATLAYENARIEISKLFNLDENFDLIFTKSTTESINLIARAWGGKFLQKSDCVLISEMEHHANLVPWQIIAKEREANLLFAKIDSLGQLDMSDFEEKLSKNNVKIVSIAHASNVLGTINDVEKISELCKKYGALLSVDAAQSSPHFLVDAKKIDADFISLSAHKCYGPTGIGVLIAKKEILENMNVYQGGGDMVDVVDFLSSTYKSSPEKYEAGTQNISGVISFGYVAEFLATIDRAKISENETLIKNYLDNALPEIKGLRVLGNAKNKLPLYTFVCDNIHPHDIASLLDTNGIALRSGNHCSQVLGKILNAPISCRASFAFYNTLSEAEFFVEKLKRAISILA